MESEALRDVIMPLQDLKVEIANVVFVDLTAGTFKFDSRPPDLGRDAAVRDHGSQIGGRVVLVRQHDYFNRRK